MVIEYTYEYLDADNKWKPLNDENAVKLKNAPIRVNVTVTEHFFSLKDNFVFEEKGGENTQVKTALTAKEAVGKIPNYQEQADTWTAASSDDHPVLCLRMMQTTRLNWTIRTCQAEAKTQEI